MATLLANSNAATVKLQTSRSFIQSTDAADMRLRSGRLLRTETTSDQIENTDEEERAGITDVAKKFGAATSQLFKDKALATKLKSKAMQMNLDKTVPKVEKGIDPDRTPRRVQPPQSSDDGEHRDPATYCTIESHQQRHCIIKSTAALHKQAGGRCLRARPPMVKD
ncbi:hypothetical protein JG688_00015937 [Phytophthora aleatoria]|uniref:RxLR effector protein n=1 Tax=Phytophthora aleatoria TaxID=2496075 RepID=A0A8J5ISI9_9STRA|nr:hypothetical protein JG688_00015937 [Phytophthora aleatoria]